jgi:ArsR family transcriptional regulator
MSAGTTARRTPPGGAYREPDPSGPNEPLHPEAVRQARRGRASDVSLSYLADTFKVLANPTRLRIVEALADRELCVWDLAVIADTSQSAVSHHLRQLRQMKIVRFRKEGRLAFYRLDDEHITQIFRMGREHVDER